MKNLANFGAFSLLSSGHWHRPQRRRRFPTGKWQSRSTTFPLAPRIRWMPHHHRDDDKVADHASRREGSAVGFVNEKKVYKLGEVDERIKALRMWLDYGFELGNHTFSHSSLNKVGLQAWEDDVVQGESVTRMLLAEHNMKLRYFRHPFLDTGRDLQTRREAEAFLVARGYHIAPVTLDAWDWMYAGVYDDAKNAETPPCNNNSRKAISSTAIPCLPIQNSWRSKP